MVAPGFYAEKVTTISKSFRIMVRKPSAFLPVAMSLMALALLGGAYIYGRATGQGALVREPDEDAIAHLWQLLMAGQLPVLAYFAIKWLPRAPKQTLRRACAIDRSCAGCNGTRLLPEPINFNCR